MKSAGVVNDCWIGGQLWKKCKKSILIKGLKRLKSLEKHK